MDGGTYKEIMGRAKAYIDALTVDSAHNVPQRIVADEKQFFSWDNEKRTPSAKPYLFDWSYYNGVVMEVLPEAYLERRRKALQVFVDGILPYQSKSGLWANLADRPVTKTNRLETSGTAMFVYTILKGVRKGWLDPSYREAAMEGFAGMVREKLKDGALTDIYLKASANNTNNYELTEYYLPDEGKGSGPFIMAYAEMLSLDGTSSLEA